ncbi:MAG: hypothetical protein IKQ40_01435, partial [Lachnospiraceae bacterium]|nr:hypothetical protein [Lachnospiraceae bacterium]
GEYVYRSAATEAIKTELLAGRAVGIAFCADHSMPDLTMEEKRASLEENMKNLPDITDEERKRYIDVRVGAVEVSEDELRDLIRFRLRINNMDEGLYDLEKLDHDHLKMLLNTKHLGMSYEDIDAKESKEPYMTFVGSDPVIFAQYTYESVSANHSVTAVGWDDDFSAENWPEDRRPPADGAWIVKNSWGNDWGNDGYFMLSYYDKTLCGVGTFEYVVSDISRSVGSIMIMDYDMMPAEITSSTLYDTPVYAANEFEIEEDCVLQYVSAMTGDLDTSVTASIYLLNEKSTSPTDGVLLSSVTKPFRFAGYHRLELDDNLLLPKGTKISIVILENVPVENGNKYALINNMSLNKEGAEEFNRIHEEDGKKGMRYAKGVVNPGESFVSFADNEWTDWSDAIKYFGNTGSNAYMAYDNLPIKAYVYPLKDVEKIHDLSNRIDTVGGKAAVCPEDGYTLLDITGK